MTRSRPIVLLGALALIWGSSFMFIKVADRQVEPSTLILGRLWLATLTLALVVPVLAGGRTVVADLRAHGRPLVVIGLLTRRHLSTARPHAIALGTSLVAAIAVTPAGVAQAPSDVPGWKTFASITVLGTVCTAVAYLIFFTIIARAGAGYAALVTYLVPPVALGYGALFLDEGI